MRTRIEWENLEQVARALGERWARRFASESGTSGRQGSLCPCTLHEARRLLDQALGDRISADRREPLAVILERSARAAWVRSHAAQAQTTTSLAERAEPVLTSRKRKTALD
jgi:hypothetical protein